MQATHHSTIEFTKDRHLSKKGNCILVVATDRGLPELSSQFRDLLKKPNAKLTIRIEAAEVTDEIHAKGSPKLALSHPHEMVVRKGDFLSDRTLALQADKAAKDLKRELVQKLKNPKQQAKITLTVQT